MKRTVLAVAAVLSIVPVAFAGSWSAQVQKDDFGDDHTGIAVTESKGRALGVRCENKKVPALIFATREKWGDGLGLLSAKLLIKVDSNAPVEQPAVLEEYEMLIGLTRARGVRVIATGDHLFPIVAEIINAKKRIAVAVEIGGKRFENTRFSVHGSTRALKKIWGYCGSILGDYEKPTL